MLGQSRPWRLGHPGPGFPRAAGALPSGPQREGLCECLPITPKRSSAEQTPGLGLEGVFGNLAMQCVWLSPARASKPGQAPHLRMKEHSVCALRASPLPTSCWAQGQVDCARGAGPWKRWCPGCPALNVLITRSEGHLWLVRALSAF